jgi:HAD superfamily hydrolase (TIGR01509 family)
MTTRAALFDIDGTLVDTNYLHVEAWSSAFAQLGLDVDAWRIHRGIGMDSTKLLESLLGRDAGRYSTDARQLHARFYARIADRARPFDGARELLAALNARGVAVVLATSAPQDELERNRATLRVDDVIASVTSAEDVSTAKPAPDIVRVALERADVAPADAVFIGDTVWDVIAARSAGVACLAVQSGGVSAAELLDAGATGVYADARDLLDRLDDSILIR